MLMCVRIKETKGEREKEKQQKLCVYNYNYKEYYLDLLYTLVHKYVDSDTTFAILPLYTTTSSFPFGFSL